jgi:hypothetical protein
MYLRRAAWSKLEYGSADLLASHNGYISFYGVLESSYSHAYTHIYAFAECRILIAFGVGTPTASIRRVNRSGWVYRRIVDTDSVILATTRGSIANNG